MSSKELKFDFDYEILPETNNKYDLTFKIIIIGDSGVGKSCLTQMATKNNFESNYQTTIGFEFFVLNIKIGEKIIKLQIWDTCGQEIYRSLISNFYRNSSLAIMVYSVTDRKSFENLDLWYKELRTNSTSQINVFLIGNKIDLEEEREVKTEEGETYKEKYELIKFIESSAKSGFNALNIFIQAAKLLYDEYLQENKNKMVNDSYNNDDNVDTKSIGENYGETSTLSSKRNKRSTCC
jgi:small GTP-binding protein